jgi:anthranilate synthase component 1
LEFELVRLDQPRRLGQPFPDLAEKEDEAVRLRGPVAQRRIGEGLCPPLDSAFHEVPGRRIVPGLRHEARRKHREEKPGVSNGQHIRNIVPVVETVHHIDDPVAAGARLARGPFNFVLESAAGDSRWGRYTFIGTEPREAWRYTGRGVECWSATGGWREAGETGDPIGHIGDLMRARRVEDVPDLPPFFGGAVGFLGYDVVRTLERLPGGPEDDLALPDALFLVADTVVVIDNFARTARIIGSAESAGDAGPTERRTAANFASNRITEWAKRLGKRRPSKAPAPGPADDALRTTQHAPANGTSTYPEADFMRDVAVLKDHIAAGDIFQGVLSRRIDVPGPVDPRRLHAAMRTLNPAPYVYYLGLDDFSIVGSSPEVLVRVQDREVTVRPIAGTRPRGGTPAEDAALGAALLADPKELAEHLMLVDLGRNDVGRVAAFGTVRLAESLVLERYAHVQHIVSEVRGTLAPGKDAIDALKAAFPAGTVTGAPKVRAMELLDGLEPVRRGPYAGAVGYIGWGARQLDTAITIRTCVVLPDRVSVQSGAGIVADSDPAAELLETQHKARGALRAITAARASP